MALCRVWFFLPLFAVCSELLGHWQCHNVSNLNLMGGRQRKCNAWVAVTSLVLLRLQVTFQKPAQKMAGPRCILLTLLWAVDTISTALAMMWVDWHSLIVNDQSCTAGNGVQSQRSGRIEWEALFFALWVGVIGCIGEITVLIGCHCVPHIRFCSLLCIELPQVTESTEYIEWSCQRILFIFSCTGFLLLLD